VVVPSVSLDLHLRHREGIIHLLLTSPVGNPFASTGYIHRDGNHLVGIGVVADDVDGNSVFRLVTQYQKPFAFRIEFDGLSGQNRLCDVSGANTVLAGFCERVGGNAKLALANKSLNV
jgi:hypothetical protein